MDPKDISERFPKLPESQAIRRVYFDILDAASAIALTKNRYEPVHIMAMPVGTVEQRREQLAAVLQGLADGTIDGDSQRLKGLELALKTLGMLTDVGRETSKPSNDPQTTKDLIEALRASVGSTLKAVTGVNRDDILEAYGQGGAREEITGKIRARKSIKKDK